MLHAFVTRGCGRLCAGIACFVLRRDVVGGLPVEEDAAAVTTAKALAQATSLVDDPVVLAQVKTEWKQTHLKVAKLVRDACVSRLAAAKRQLSAASSALAALALDAPAEEGAQAAASCSRAAAAVTAATAAAAEAAALVTAATPADEGPGAAPAAAPAPSVPAPPPNNTKFPYVCDSTTLKCGLPFACIFDYNAHIRGHLLYLE